MVLSLLLCCACTKKIDKDQESKPTATSKQEPSKEDSNSTTTDNEDFDDEFDLEDDDEGEDKISSQGSQSQTNNSSTSNGTTNKNNTTVSNNTITSSNTNNATNNIVNGSSTNQSTSSTNATSSQNTTTTQTCTHNLSAATCTKAPVCSICNTVQGEALGHSFRAATCTQPKKCTVCGIKEGSTVGHNYVTGECTYCGVYSKTYCPKLYFTGDMSGMNSKKDERNITFEYKSNGLTFTGAAKIKPQGSSSLGYAKKNYTINFYQDSSYSKKLSVDVGWGKQSKYCLKANWIDKTHSRNVVTAKIVSQVQQKYNLFMSTPNNGAVDGYPVEIYINGQFHGLYTMNIPKDAWMFNMDKDNPNHIVLCGENWTGPVLFKEFPNNFDFWSVEVGPENDETMQKLKRLIGFVRDSTDEEFKEHFEEYLNLDATLNYYVMMYYGWLPDNAGKNMLLVTYDGKVWYPSLYDLDTSWGTDWKGLSIYDYKNGEMKIEENVLWTRMEKLYSKEIAERYFELRKNVLDTNNVMNMFTNFYNTIPQEVIDREVAKWGTNIPGYDISQISDYLKTFIPRLDAKFSAWR